jgi:hypothetical protein
MLSAGSQLSFKIMSVDVVWQNSEGVHNLIPEAYTIQF